MALGNFMFKLLQRIHQNPADGEIAKPFVIRRDDVPWRILGIAASDGLLVSFLIIIPELPLLEIG